MTSMRSSIPATSARKLIGRGAAQLHEQRVGGVAHADADRRDVVEIDLRRRRRRREPADRGRVQALGGDPRERVRRQAAERLLDARAAGDDLAAAPQQALEHAGRVLERLALEQPGQQQVALLEAEQLLVELGHLRAGQQAADLELDERRRDQQELGGDVEIDPVDRLDLDEERVDHLGDLDVPDVHLFLQDEMEEELERPLVHRDADGVGHRAVTLAGGTRSITGYPGHFQSSGAGRAGAGTFPQMTRQFSGIQPTGEMHLGNFAGAVKRWVDQQDDGIFCVVDLHAMTHALRPGRAHRRDPPPRRPAPRRRASIRERCTLFVQSHVPVVTELTWILNCVATVGELRRMTQFKEKGEGQESVSAGLLDYPVLMAADILLYDTDEVPVGEDQTQHVELTRDVAIRFNHRFGDTLVVPKATLPPVGARIKDLQNPTAKMSKSVDSPQGTILVLDEPKAITKKVKSAVTDSDTAVRFDVEAKPGVSNLLSLLSVATGRPIPDLEAEYGTSGYGTFKGAVADALVEYLRPTRERYHELAADPAELARLLAVGAGTREEIADATMARVRAATGLLPRGLSDAERATDRRATSATTRGSSSTAPRSSATRSTRSR